MPLPQQLPQQPYKRPQGFQPVGAQSLGVQPPQQGDYGASDIARGIGGMVGSFKKGHKAAQPGYMKKSQYAEPAGPPTAQQAQPMMAPQQPMTQQSPQAGASPGYNPMGPAMGGNANMANRYRQAQQNNDIPTMQWLESMGFKPQVEEQGMDPRNRMMR